MRAAWMAAIVFLLTTLSAASQPAPATQGRLTLRGVVVDAGNGAVLRRARIDVISGSESLGAMIISSAPGAVTRLSSSGRARVGGAITDEGGGFSVSVPAGTPLSLQVIKAGYAVVTLAVSQEQLRAPVPLRLAMPRGAVITGRVVDPQGQPVPVSTIQVRPSGPDARARLDEFVALGSDDRGEFRVGGLAAGRYVVDGVGQGVAPGFRIGAVEVDLEAGAEVSVNLLFERAPVDPRAPVATPRASAGGSTLRGTVSTTSGEPLSNATVTATRRGDAGTQTARTDAFGRFTLNGLSPGSFTVRASKRGYLASQYGQRGVELPGLPVVVAAGKDVADIAIVLPRGSAVSGMVVDEYGEPLQDAAVQLLRVRRSLSGLVALREQGLFARRTDDRGEFTLNEVVPGDYILTSSLPAETVDPAPAARTAYAPVYYPGTPDFSSASILQIASGEDVPGLVLTMRRVPVVRVAGIARNSQGLPFTGTVRLTPRPVGHITLEGLVVHPEASGEFAFADVPPGEYVLRTLVPAGPSGPEFAANHVTVVDRDSDPLMIRTAPGSTVSGRFVLEGGNDGALLWGYSATTVPLDSAVPSGSVSNLGSPMSSGEAFTLSALAGPTRLRVWSDDEDWYLKSILIGGFDAADSVFDFGYDGRAYADVEVVFSRLGASIAGRATDDRARPVRDYAVYAFSADRDKWVAGSRWVKLARSSGDGGFKVPSLPPGEYWVAAIDRVDASPGAADWVDAELLELLSSRAARVTLGEGQALTISLRLINR